CRPVLAVALQYLLEALVALRDFLAGVGSGERREEHAETLALELECKGQPRPRAAVKRFDGHGAERADGSVDASERDLVRRIMLRDLVADLACAARQLPRVSRAAADTGRALGLDANAVDLILPFAVPAQVIDIREDVFRAACDLDALDDRCHQG